jgi:hypothetical protein
MRDTETPKSFIFEAMRHMPDDFALSEARFYLNSALQAIEHVEAKRARRATNAQPPPQNIAKTTPVAPSPFAQEAKQPVATNWTPENVINVLGYLDGMIDEEKKKIEDLHNPPEEPTDLDTLLG